MERVSLQKLHDQLSAVMDIKDAAEMKDPFGNDIEAPHREEVYELNHDLDAEFASPRPNLDRLEKLVCIKEQLRVRHADVAPEEELWRDQMEDAIKPLE